MTDQSSSPPPGLEELMRLHEAVVYQARLSPGAFGDPEQAWKDAAAIFRAALTNALTLSEEDVERAARELFRIGNERIGVREWDAVKEHYLYEARAALTRALTPATAVSAPGAGASKREWLVIESSMKNAVFAAPKDREPRGYIPRDVAEALLGRDLGGTVWFTREEGELMRGHNEWRETEPPPSGDGPEAQPLSATEVNSRGPGNTVEAAPDEVRDITAEESAMWDRAFAKSVTIVEDLALTLARQRIAELEEGLRATVEHISIPRDMRNNAWHLDGHQIYERARALLAPAATKGEES